MLPDQYRQLLTAYVDGELSSRQRKHVVRLLQRSGDARQLLSRLQQDAAALGKLTTPKLDHDLSAAVLYSIRERRLTPIRRKPKPLTPAFPAWVGLAIAASVLCMIGLAWYMGFAAFLAHSPPAPADVPMAHTEQPEKTPVTPPNRAEKHETKPDVARNDKPPHPREFVGPPQPGPGDIEPPDVVVKAPPEKEPYGPPEPEPRKEELGPVLTSPEMERFHLEMVVGTRRLILSLHDLDQADKQKKLLDELTKDAGFRLELPCDNGSRAFDRLQAACKEQKIAVLIDQQAKKRLGTPQAKTNYVLYIENVTPDELARFVQQLGAEDKKAAAKKSSDAHFGKLVVTPLTKRDYKELSDLLGIDPSKVEPPKTTGPLGTDLRKPLSEQTAEEVARAVSGEKSASKSAVAHQALVLAYNPVLPPKNSPEVKRFLDERKPAKPDTVRAILVLRSM